MIHSTPKGSIEVEAELSSPSASVQLVHYHFNEPPHSVLHAGDTFRIELCLTSRHRSARACFSDLWSAQRYERIGDLFIAPPDLALRAGSDEDTSLTSIVCQLSRESIVELYDNLPEPTERSLLASLDVQDDKVRNLLLRLAEEARQPGFASEMLVDSIVSQMVVELFRHGCFIAENKSSGGLAPWQLRRIDERLSEVRETPTLSVLAALCRISVRQLTRGFRASRSCSIGAYVAQSQIKHAKTLLAADESVASIAHTLGFSSPSNFCVAFRREIGITPGQFRQRLLRS